MRYAFLVLAVWMLSCGQSSSSYGNPPVDAGPTKNPQESGPASPPIPNSTPSSQAPRTVGGVVTGLVGTGLTLSNNDSDVLTLSQSGLFQFPSKLSPGQAYHVKVVTPPSNPQQTCKVSSPNGTVGNVDVQSISVECRLMDSDGDRIPDVADPFPADASRPKPAPLNAIHPHSATTLYILDISNYSLSTVGNFNGPTFSGQMTDLAIDGYGVIYGMTHSHLYTCDSGTATCYRLAALPEPYNNGLTFLPAGSSHPFLETLVAVAHSGTWYKVDIANGSATMKVMGSYGTSYSSSGDVFSIDGLGTFASVDRRGATSDVIVRVDASNGRVLSEVGTMAGFTSCFGLAGASGVVLGFDESGAILQLNLTTGSFSVAKQTDIAFWGAGVSTSYPID